MKVQVSFFHCLLLAQIALLSLMMLRRKTRLDEMRRIKGYNFTRSWSERENLSQLTAGTLTDLSPGNRQASPTTPRVFKFVVRSAQPQSAIPATVQGHVLCLH